MRHRVATYIAKYVGTRAHDAGFNNKRYWTSKGIVLSEVTTYAHLGADSSRGEAAAAAYACVDTSGADFNGAQLMDTCVLDGDGERLDTSTDVNERYVANCFKKRRGRFVFGTFLCFYAMIQLELWERAVLTRDELASITGEIRNLYWGVRNFRHGVYQARCRKIYRKVAVKKTPA